MSSETETFALLPCPFCGDLASMHHDPLCFRGASGYRVECEGRCHAMTCWWHTLEQAVEHWNMRTNVAKTFLDVRVPMGDNRDGKGKRVQRLPSPRKQPIGGATMRTKHTTLSPCESASTPDVIGSEGGNAA